MELDVASLMARWADHEAAVDATPGIDHWCSGPDWLHPVRHGFAPSCETLSLQTNGGFAALGFHPSEEEVIVAGFEPLWGFACPIVGSDPAHVAHAVAGRLSEDERWSRLILPGFPTDMTLAREVAEPLSSLGPVMGASGMVRMTAGLDDFDQWMSRRPRSFRRNLRQASSRAAAAGLSFVEADNDPGLMDRLVAIEQRSWKGRADDGITTPAMSSFYRALIERLQQRDRCRAVVAQLGGEDVGFILGGVRSRSYRGLQLSYSTGVRELSVGHLLQLHEIERLTCRDEVDLYDLGMEMDYKTRWADESVSSLTVVVDRGARSR